MDLKWFADRRLWEGLRSVGVVESVRQVGAQALTVERRYYLSSLPQAVERIARAVRGRAKRPKPGPVAPVVAESPTPRENQTAWDQRQTTQRRLES